MKVTVFWDVIPCGSIDINVLEECAASIFIFIVYPEDGGSRFFRNVGTCLPNYTALP
jgi:hypothetical protein